MKIVAAQMAFAFDLTHAVRGPGFVNVEAVDVCTKRNTFAFGITSDPRNDAGLHVIGEDFDAIDFREVFATGFPGVVLCPGRFGVLVNSIFNASDLRFCG